jgi:hypothetical protein
MQVDAREHDFVHKLVEQPSHASARSRAIMASDLQTI